MKKNEIIKLIIIILFYLYFNGLIYILYNK